MKRRKLRPISTDPRYLGKNNIPFKEKILQITSTVFYKFEKCFPGIFSWAPTHRREPQKKIWKWIYLYNSSPYLIVLGIIAGNSINKIQFFMQVNVKCLKNQTPKLPYLQTKNKLPSLKGTWTRHLHDTFCCQGCNIHGYRCLLSKHNFSSSKLFKISFNKKKNMVSQDSQRIPNMEKYF